MESRLISIHSGRIDTSNAPSYAEVKLPRDVSTLPSTENPLRIFGSPTEFATD
jgi:hypothetical protein